VGGNRLGVKIMAEIQRAKVIQKDSAQQQTKKDEPSQEAFLK